MQSRCNRLIVAGLCASMLGLLPWSAAAQGEWSSMLHRPLTLDRPVALVAGTAATWESNVFRLPQPTSDRLITSYVGLRLDQPYAQQRFQVDVFQGMHRYERLSYLNFDPLQYRAAWYWRLTPRLSGIASADRTQALVNYGDFRVETQRNIRTAETRLLTGDAWLFSGWHLTGAAMQQESRNEQVFLLERGYRGNSVEGGIKYVLHSDSSLGFSQRSVRAEYLERALDPATLVDDGFTRTDSEMQARWVISVKSTLDARLARVDYRSNHFSQRDFSALAGTLRLGWLPTSRLTINLAASQDPSPSSDAFSARVERRVLLAPKWQITATTALSLNVERQNADYRQPVLAALPRQDNMRTVGALLDWRLSRFASVKAGLQDQRRDSSDSAFAFRARAVSFGAALTY